LVLSGSELLEDLINCGCESLTFSVTNINFLKGREFHDGAGEMHDVLASFRERIKSNEKGVGSDLPLILGSLLVLKVAHFELLADIECLTKLIIS
jgi:hypothetical protein